LGGFSFYFFPPSDSLREGDNKAISGNISI